MYIINIQLEKYKSEMIIVSIIKLKNQITYAIICQNIIISMFADFPNLHVRWSGDI